MRVFRLLILFGTMLWTTQSFASTYYIDLNNPVGVTTSPTAYDVYAPVHGPIQAYLTPVFHLHAEASLDISINANGQFEFMYSLWSAAVAPQGQANYGVV